MNKTDLEILKLVLEGSQEKVESVLDPVKLVRAVAFNEGIAHGFEQLKIYLERGVEPEYLKYLQNKVR